MKKTVLMIAVIFGLAVSASAQDERKREKPSAEQMTEQMKKELDLTDEQYKLVYAANEDLIKMIDEAGGRKADRETKTQIRKQHLLKLNEVLTPEQMGKMKDRRQARDVKNNQTHKERIED